MSKLTVTNNTISLDSTVYQIRNITQVGKYRIKPKYFFSLFVIIISGIIGFYFLPLLIIPLIGIIERALKKTRYGLALETNSGGTSLIASTNQSFIDNIIKKIIDVMNNQHRVVNHTFNISKGDIINQEGVFQNGVRIS